MPAPEPLPDCRQTNAHSCATAAWRTVYKFHVGRNARVVDLSHPIRGTAPATLEAMIRLDANWNVRSGESMLDDLRHYAASWRPPICLVTWPGDEDSHYIIVSGVWRGRVYYQDPETGPQSMRDDHFLNCWLGRGEHVDYERWSIVAWPAV